MEILRQIKKKSRKSRRVLIPILICLCIGSIMGFLSYYTILEEIELILFEIRYKLYTFFHALEPSENLVLVQIDKESEINEPLGEDWNDWTSDMYLFPLVNSLIEAQVNSIGITMSFDRECESDKEFANEVHFAKDYLFLATPYKRMEESDKEIPTVEGMIESVPFLQENAKGSAFLGHIKDSDKVYRWAQLVVRDKSFKNLPSQEQYRYSLAVQLMANFLNAKARFDEEHSEILFTRKDETVFKIPTNRQGQMLIAFLPSKEEDKSPFFSRSIHKLLQPEEIETNQEKYKDKIVLVGVSSDIKGSEKFLTPQNQMRTGILLQANILNTMLSRRFITRWNKLSNILCLIIVCLITAATFIISDSDKLWKESQTKILLFGVAIIILYIVFSICFYLIGYWIDLVYPILAVGIGAVATGVSLNSEELTERSDKLVKSKRDLELAIEELGKINEEKEKLIFKLEEMNEEKEGLISELQGINEEKEKLISALEVKNKKLSQIIIQLEEAQNQLEIEAELKRMVKRVAHEINNSVTPISGKATKARRSLLSNEPVNNKEIVGKLTEIIALVDEIGDVVEEAFVYFDQPLKLKKKNIHDILMEAEGRVADTFQENEVTVHDVEDPYFPQVLLDERQIRMVFVNLIKNAYQAMPKGGRLTLRTTYKKEEVGGVIVVEVSDTGRGMRPEVQNQIFSPLFGTKGRGWGMGLFNVKKIVEKHNWTVKFESELEKGTSFFITIPIQEV